MIMTAFNFRRAFVVLLKEIKPIPTNIAPISGNTGINQAYAYKSSIADPANWGLMSEGKNSSIVPQASGRICFYLKGWLLGLRSTLLQKSGLCQDWIFDLVQCTKPSSTLRLKRWRVPLLPLKSGS
jgi:hypothetical protein